MTDQTKNFLTELADLLDKHDGSIHIRVGAEEELKVDLISERDNYTNIFDGCIFYGSDSEITPTDIRQLIRH